MFYMSILAPLRSFEGNRNQGRVEAEAEYFSVTRKGLQLKGSKAQEESKMMKS
jgi:hypothetical protein